MILKDIIEKIEKFCPQSLSCDWDNTGLLCGDENKNVNKILLALDVSTPVLNEALQIGADMLITHHPIMFSGIQKVTPKTPDGKLLLTLIENNIALYSAHTNMDMCQNGLNDYILKLINLTDVETLVPDENIPGAGIGKIGLLPFSDAISLKTLAEYVKQSLKADFVRFTGSPNTDVKKVAIVTGSGSDYIDAAISKGADVLITGDIKYHTALEAVEKKVCIIDAGHFSTEIMVTDIFEQILKPISGKVKIFKSSQKDVFSYV
ncbi:MAG: Nif3-like dinuclear metal center hexameric protein [Clostridia bacterium]|nr:Nif3-like dinuclear metal center hexameric protein [Clostridia bacterium]